MQDPKDHEVWERIRAKWEGKSEVERVNRLNELNTRLDQGLKEGTMYALSDEEVTEVLFLSGDTEEKVEFGRLKGLALIEGRLAGPGCNTRH